jgi:hypothetical protein
MEKKISIWLILSAAADRRGMGIAHRPEKVLREFAVLVEMRARLPERE